MIPTVGFNMRKVTRGNVTIKVSAWGYCIALLSFLLKFLDYIEVVVGPSILHHCYFLSIDPNLQGGCNWDLENSLTLVPSFLPIYLFLLPFSTSYFPSTPLSARGPNWCGCIGSMRPAYVIIYTITVCELWDMYDASSCSYYDCQPPHSFHTFLLSLCAQHLCVPSYKTSSPYPTIY